MTTATITRITETYDIADSYKLTEEYTLTATPSADATVTAMKELMVKLAGREVLGYSEENGWGSLLLDMVCLKAADRSNWQQPIAHLLPVLKRLGTEAQVEQALTEFAEDNAPTFTTIEEFEWDELVACIGSRITGGATSKKFVTPEIQQGFWNKMQEFWEKWEPCTPELESDFAEFQKAAMLAGLNDLKENFIRINTDTAPAWYVDAIRERGIEIKETVEQMLARERVELEAKYAQCQPSYSESPTLDEYRKALSTVDDPSVPDTTGVRGFVELVLPGAENKAQRSQFYAYLISRLDIEKSKVRRLLLEATTGEAVYSPLIQVFNNRKWAAYSPDEIAVEEVKEVVSPDELFTTCIDEANFEPAFARAEELKQQITDGISEIANNHSDENPLMLTDGMPQWLLDLFRQNNVFTEPTIYSYFRIQAEGKNYICKTVDEFFDKFDRESYDSIEGVNVDNENCIVGNFYWNDWGFEPQLVHLANGEDFDAYIASEDGGTGHFVYEYFEVVNYGKVTQRVVGTDPENPYPPNVQKFADAVELPAEMQQNAESAYKSFNREPKPELEKSAKEREGDLISLVDSLKDANSKLDAFDLIGLTDYTSVVELADEWYAIVYGEKSIPSKILALDAYLMSAPIYMDSELEGEIIDWYKKEVLDPAHMNDFFSRAGTSFYDVIKGASLAFKLTGDINSSTHGDLWRKAATEYWRIGELPKPFTRNQALSAVARYISNVAEAIDLNNLYADDRPKQEDRNTTSTAYATDYTEVANFDLQAYVDGCTKEEKVALFRGLGDQLQEREADGMWLKDHESYPYSAEFMADYISNHYVALMDSLFVQTEIEDDSRDLIFTYKDGTEKQVLCIGWIGVMPYKYLIKKTMEMYKIDPRKVKEDLLVDY